MPINTGIRSEGGVGALFFLSDPFVRVSAFPGPFLTAERLASAMLSAAAETLASQEEVVWA